MNTYPLRLAVYSPCFSLYKALKEEAEKRGWQHIAEFNPFTEEQTGPSRILYFSEDWNGRPNGFSFSNSTITHRLPDDWYEVMKVLSSVPTTVKVSKQEIADWKGIPVERLIIES